MFKKISDIIFEKRLVILVLCLMISLLLFFSAYSQGQTRFTVFKTDNRGFKFIFKNNTVYTPALYVADIGLGTFFKVPGYLYIQEIGINNRNSSQVRCECDITDTNVDCPAYYYTINNMGPVCYDWYRREIAQDPVAAKFNKYNQNEGFYGSFLRVGWDGKVGILGDLIVEKNENNNCVWIPGPEENNYRDIGVVSGVAETICPSGYFMKGIRFRGSSRDVNSLDMWSIQCCKL